MDKTHSRIDNAINKYGVENFEFKVLIFLHPNFLNEAEEFFINVFNTFKDPFHYNLTPGGDFNPLIVPEIREKHKSIMASEKNPLYKVIDKDQFLNDAKSGMNYSQLSEKYDVSPKVVYSRLEEYLSPEEYETLINNFIFIDETQFLEDAKSGMDTAQLSEKYEISRSVVYRRLEDLMSTEEYGIYIGNGGNRIGGNYKKNIERHNYRHDVSNKEVLKLFKKGHSAREIGRRMNCDVGTITDRLKLLLSEEEYKKYVFNNKLSGKDHPNFREEIVTEKLIELIEEGYNLHKLCQEFKCSRNLIIKRLNHIMDAEQVEKIKTGEYQMNKRDEKIKELYYQKVPVKKICEKFKLSSSTVYRVLNK